MSHNLTSPVLLKEIKLPDNFPHTLSRDFLQKKISAFLTQNARGQMFFFV